jgi:hypothetical protein
MREPRPRPALKYGDDRLSVSGELCRSARSKRERGRLVRPVFGIGFQGRSIVRVPLKPHLGVSCIWRLLNFAVWPGRKPFGGAENSSIGFICELKKQVRLCPVLFGEGQSAISDRARIAHGASQIPTPAHTAGTGLKPAAYGLNAHLELQVLNGGARNRRRPCGGGDQPAFRSSPAKPAPEQAAVDSANGYLAGDDSVPRRPHAPHENPYWCVSQANTAQTTRMARATTIQSLKLIR